MLIFLSNCNSLKINNETIFNKEQFIDLVINHLVDRASQRENISNKAHLIYKEPKEDKNILNEPMPEYINEEKLTAVLKYELAPSVNEAFPHIYGMLNLDAVVKVENL